MSVDVLRSNCLAITKKIECLQDISTESSNYDNTLKHFTKAIRTTTAGTHGGVAHRSDARVISRAFADDRVEDLFLSKTYVGA